VRCVPPIASNPLILKGHPGAADLRYPVVTALLHLHAFLLLPLFHHLWIGTGTGNANFFYASTLVFGLANGGALLDCVWAGLRVAIGEEKDGWVVTQE
jgi:phosphatidylinositol glycan class U